MSKKHKPPLQADDLAAKVAASSKYRPIHPSLIEVLARSEASKSNSIEHAAKRVKRTLHQMVGAYLQAPMRFDDWLSKLAAAANEADQRSVCRDILAYHASTRERLAGIEAFFAAVFGGLPRPRVVADLACGLNPIARPFMGLPRETILGAYDVHAELVGFVLNALNVMRYPAIGGPWNLLDGPPPINADVVLLLKALPCLAHADKQAARMILDRLAAPVVVVSFPISSLGGSRRGMPAFYGSQFRNLIKDGSYEIEELNLPTELVFRVRRRPA